MIQSRQFQVDAQRQINTLLNAKRHPVYLAPCGTGKTYTAAAIIKDRIYLNRRVFVLVPQVEIFDEWMRVLSEFGLNPGYINDEGIRGKDRGVYVCMALSLINIIGVLSESLYPDEIITDEMQHSLADSWEQIYGFFHNATRLGLTATLYHGSLRSFEHLYTDVVQTISKSHAIAGSWITKPLLMIPELYAPDVPMNGADFDMEVQADLLGKPQIVGDVIDFYERTFEGRCVIVPCCTFEHAQQMKEAFNAKGWVFEHIHSALSKHERKRILRLIRAGQVNGICTVGIGIEGMSIPGLWGVLWLRRTLSPIIWTQFNGRAERIIEGKDHYICADFVGNSVLHGMPDRDLSWTLEQEDVQPNDEDVDRSALQICPVCGVVNSSMNTICHFCGANIDDAERAGQKPQRIPAYVDGNLVVLDSNGYSPEGEHAQRTNDIKAAQAQARKAEPIREIGAHEKAQILHKNLFAGNRRKLFAETLKDWI